MECKKLSVNFESGKLLTKSMLVVMQNIAEQKWRLYENYPNGIIEGIDFCTDKDKRLYITTGFVKLDNTIYYMDKPVYISDILSKIDGDIDQEKYIMILEKSQSRKLSESVVGDYLKFNVVKSEQKLNDLQIPIAMFTRKSTEQSLYNILSEKAEQKLEDTINNGYFSPVFACYSTKTGLTLHPYIFSLLAEMLEGRLSNLTSLEEFILSSIYQDGFVAIKVLELYISKYASISEFSETKDKVNLIKQLKNVVGMTKNIYAERMESSKTETQTATVSRRRRS